MGKQGRLRSASQFAFTREKNSAAGMTRPQRDPVRELSGTSASSIMDRTDGKEGDSECSKN